MKERKIKNYALYDYRYGNRWWWGVAIGFGIVVGCMVVVVAMWLSQ